ncbi:hypothetical protein C2L92_06060 [Coxiella burnetii]|nr:hypothetical protein CbuQ195_09610 [Coxiella burnetii]PNT79601.1 hypothetical protein C2L92_06060 [Coxiella burnetii]PNT80923.1 hypothetical protein C2L91_06165 [Coxiella burnetii]PNT83868.1 hypothetical protein C2L90_06130 [Coxiella burnetii]PNT87855.1 hypothetical protein C2L94_05200 [Coxiella burnetii]
MINKKIKILTSLIGLLVMLGFSSLSFGEICPTGCAMESNSGKCLCLLGTSFTLGPNCKTSQDLKEVICGKHYYCSRAKWSHLGPGQVCCQDPKVPSIQCR